MLNATGYTFNVRHLSHSLWINDSATRYFDTCRRHVWITTSTVWANEHLFMQSLATHTNTCLLSHRESDSEGRAALWFLRSSQSKDNLCWSGAAPCSTWLKCQDAFVTPEVTERSGGRKVSKLPKVWFFTASHGSSPPIVGASFYVSDKLYYHNKVIIEVIGLFIQVFGHKTIC